MSTSTKCRIILITRKVRNGVKTDRYPVYVGYTTEKEPKVFLSNFKSNIKMQNENASKKIAAAKLYTSDLEIEVIDSAFIDDAATKVNHYIAKYNTLEAGLNSELRV